MSLYNRLISQYNRLMSLYNRLISRYNRLMSLYNRLTETGQQKKNFFLRGDFRPLPKKNVQFWDHFFPELFPKDSESLKILDIRLREVGANIYISAYMGKRDTQTRKHTDIATTRSNRPSGPIQWKSFDENKKKVVFLNAFF